MEIRKKTVCPLDCPDSCGMIAIVRQGKVTALQGDPDHPFTAGFVCRKMRRYPERLNSPDRLLHPLRRVGRKGAGDFVRIGWEEAWQILTEQLQQTVNRYGGEAILPYHYGGNMGLLHRFAGHSLFYRLGASRLEETICSAAASSGWQLHCGKTPSSPPGNVVEADLVVVWGCNLKVTNVHFWRLVVQARSRGAHLVVIDPYRTATAASADTHLQVRPGGDHALALGLIKVLLEKDWIDHSFIREQTRGFELLVELLAETSWEQLVDTCGISRSQMEELARLFSIHPRTFLRIGIGLSRNSHGGAAIRGIASLAAVLGLFDTSPGRGLFLTSGAFHGRKEKLTYPTLGPAAGRLVNMNRLGEALTLLDPPVRLLFVYNANPLSSAPDSSQVRAGLKREDLFTVVHEQVMSPTARYADLVLPATTFLENRDLYTAYGHFHLALVDPAIPPMGEAISNFQLFQTLAGKLGFDDPLFCQSLDQRLADYLQDLEGLPQGVGHPLPPGEWIGSTRAVSAGSLLEPDHPFRFVTPGDPPLLPLDSLGEFRNPDLARRYPFRLITPPHPDLLNSTFGERFPDRPGEVFIHPQDAVEQEIREGEPVFLVNDRGRSRRIVRITAKTQPGLLVAEGVYWPGRDDERAINDLTSQALTDLGGGATFHESRVRLERAEGAE